jgi:hypothetical protein
VAQLSARRSSPCCLRLARWCPLGRGTPRALAFTLLAPRTPPAKDNTPCKQTGDAFPDQQDSYNCGN